MEEDKSLSYSESFEEVSKSSPAFSACEEEYSGASKPKITKKDSAEGTEGVSSESVLVSLMSTIHEEELKSRSSSQSGARPPPKHKSAFSASASNASVSQVQDSEGDRVPQALQSLQCFIEGAGDSTTSSRSQTGQSQSHSVEVPVQRLELDLAQRLEMGLELAATPSDSDSDLLEDEEDSGLMQIMEKLNQLQNSQARLNKALESGKSQSEIKAAVENVLSFLPSDALDADAPEDGKPSRKKPNRCSVQSQKEEDALSQEMKKLQQIIDDKDASESVSNAVKSKSNASNGLKESIEGLQREQIEFERVIKEYEDLEITYSQQSLNLQLNTTNASCDEQESIKSEAVDDFKSPFKASKSNSANAASKSKPMPGSPNSNFSVSSSLTRTNVEVPLKSKLYQATTAITNDADAGTFGGAATTTIPTASLQHTVTATFSYNADERPISPMKSNRSLHQDYDFQYQNRPKAKPKSSSRERPVSPSLSSPALNSNVEAFKIKRRSNFGSPAQSIQSGRCSDKGGKGEGGGGSGGSIEQEKEAHYYQKKIENLEKEAYRQECLIKAFQQENEKLSTNLKSKEDEFLEKEAELVELVNSLKTEVATLKVTRYGSPFKSSVPNPNPNPATKLELEKLKEESSHKSLQLIELRKEILVLNNTLSELSKQKTMKQSKAQLVSQQKDKDHLNQIQSLNKQIRTLQKILYRKDPTAAAAFAAQGNVSNHPNEAFSETPSKEVAVLENRIHELESHLAQTDSDAKERLKDFQGRLNSLKSKYEDQLKEYELQLEEASLRINSLEESTAQGQISDLKARLDRSAHEINHLKIELAKSKRELEIAAKSSSVSGGSALTAKQDAGTLSLAIKSFKSELAEKEKEIVRMKKEIGDLNRTNNNLKREREKYLGGVGSKGSLRVPTATSGPTSGGSKSKGTKEDDLLGLSPLKNGTSCGGNGTSLTTSMTNQMLQSAMEFERNEFNEIIESKKKELEEKNKIIHRLKTTLDTLESGQSAVEMDEASKSHMLNELRCRVSTQNELISKLREHISYYQRIEGEYIRLKEDKSHLQLQIKELTQRLELAQTLAKPENEVLELLSKKFDELNSRYLGRERQLDSLLSRLELSGSGGGLSARSSQLSDFELRDLSPSLSIHLFNPSDLPQI